MNPLPISAAAAALASWVTRRARCQSDCSSPHRAQVRVRLDQGGALAWLRAQLVQQKLYFRDRFANFEVAALGFLVCSRGAVLTEAEHIRLSSLLSGPDMRMYGALRFDDGELRGTEPTIDSVWEPYEGYVFVLPAIELIRDASGLTCLAVNMLQASDAPQLLRVLGALRATPRPLHTLPAAFMMPCAQTIENIVQFSDWDESMRTILKALAAEEYQKIVLARGKRFLFNPITRQDPVQILAALDESNRRQPGRTSHADHTASIPESGDGANASGNNSYLFCLQLDYEHAFLGCTPERLFRLRGSEVLTNAIAGTVRRARDNEDALLRELWGSKNVAEHNFVVDHIRAVLEGLGARVCTSPTNVLPLPRLMHLSTAIVGLLNAEDENAGDTSRTVFRLLKSMHPTPAVCGMPREKTLRKLAKIEKFDRGHFAGPFGWFSRTESEFCVAIRSAIVSGNMITAFAGSGIVRGSESISEWDETELKMSAFTDLFTGDQALRNRREEPEWQTRPKVERSGKVVESIAQGTCALPNGNAGHNTHGQHIHRPTPNGIHSEEDDLRPFDSSRLHRENNLNALWGCATIEELCRNGIDAFFVAPGSRSAPLAVGVVRSPHAKLFVVHDERSAGFLAVGFARATGRAAAVITSSGTAVANLMPAVVEAHMDNLPMILLTADRPPELRDVGANQAINQVNLLGSYTRWFVDIPCPVDQIPLRKLLSDVDHAVHMSGSLPLFNLSPAVTPTQDCGPVHMNFMFREHLAPIRQAWDRACLQGLSASWTQSARPITVHGAGNANVRSLVDAILPRDGPHDREVGHSRMENVFSFLDKCYSGVIITGGGPGSLQCEEARLFVTTMAEELGWPILADVASGMRFDSECRNLVPFADQILVSSKGKSLLDCQVVLQFGERLVSKRFLQLIPRLGTKGNLVHILVSPRQKRNDQMLTVTHRLVCTTFDFVSNWCVTKNVVLERFIPSGNPSCGSKDSTAAAKNRDTNLAELLTLSSKVNTVLMEKMNVDGKCGVREPWLARCIINSITYSCALYLGNSMPIRDIDMFAGINAFSSLLRIGANRGASGIDGVVSSGIGFGLGLGMHSVIVVGDMSFLHDMNALHFLRTAEQGFDGKPVSIVVVNNGGGAIFSMLPIAKFNTVFSPVFDTPHSVRFRSLAQMFQLDYICATTVSEVRNALSRPATQHRLIEVQALTNHHANADLHRDIAADVSRAISDHCRTLEMNGR